MIITISGMPGSGKSTLAKYLSRAFKLKYYGMGHLRRKMAKEKGLDINQWNRYGEKNPFTDTEIDNFLKTLAGKDKIIIDGRMAFYFIPNSIKIFVKVAPEVGAKRIFKTYRKSENYKDLKDACEKLKKRVRSDCYRYKKYYKVDVLNLRNYNIIFDTTNMSIDEAKRNIKKSVEKYIKGHKISNSE